MGGVGSGRRPREYPPDVVDQVRQLYESGLTVRQVQALIPGYKVQNLMARCGIAPRHSMPMGPANAGWRGDAAAYLALHRRVMVRRGRPSLCERCGVTDGKFEWANLTGQYADVDDYARMCISCHRRFDAERRRLTGRWTTPERFRREVGA